MKSVLTITGVIVLATALLSTVAHAQKTSAAYDQRVDFSNYKTFMFSSETGARNPLVNELIVTAVEREFASRGLTKVDANADLRVSYLAALGQNVQVADVSFGAVVNPVYSGMVPIGSAMWDVTTGTLLIDLFDNKTDRVVFRGTAKEVLQRAPSADPVADAKLVSKPINKGIAKIFKKYPVKAK
ncbi:MAG: DUF4136 domain-containing protein [Pyrinomonadaceae bacterium]|nr:DUF4136 domain-containing protein [Pyrinomonadaceae bacterium]